MQLHELIQIYNLTPYEAGRIVFSAICKNYTWQQAADIGEKVIAIKMYRYGVSGCGLREAHDVVTEYLENKDNPVKDMGTEEIVDILIARAIESNGVCFISTNKRMELIHLLSAA